MKSIGDEFTWCVPQGGRQLAELLGTPVAPNTVRWVTGRGRLPTRDPLYIGPHLRDALSGQADVVLNLGHRWGERGSPHDADLDPPGPNQPGPSAPRRIAMVVHRSADLSAAIRSMARETRLKDPEECTRPPM